MTLTCLPSYIRDQLADSADLDRPGLETLVWDGDTAPPAGAAEVEFWVPAYMNTRPDMRREGFGAMPRLRVIQLLSAGVEPWLGDVPDGVLLCSGRGVHGGSTAELGLAALLALLRGLPTFWDQQRRGEWAPADAESLAGKRVLIVGAGDIGERVAAVVRLFDAEATLVARTARPGIRPVADLPGLLPESDVVVIAVPATTETRGLVDAAFLAAMPDGAVLVNVARGSIVNTDALLAQLNAGRLRAALDVTDPEPLPAGHPLWSAPNLLITPHVGGGTLGWQDRGAALVRDQLRRYLAGEPLANVVANGY